MNPFRQLFLNAGTFRIALPLALGIGVSWHLRERIEAFWYVFLAASAVMLCLMWLLGRRRASLFSYSFAVVQSLFFLLLGAALLLRYCHSLQVSWLPERTFYQGVVVDSLRSGEYVRTYEVALLEEMDSGGWHPRGARVTLTVRKDGSGSPLRTGEAVVFYGKMRNPRNPGNPGEFDYASWMLKKGVGGEIYSGSDCKRCPELAEKRLLRKLDVWTNLRIHALKIRYRLLGKYTSAGIAGDEYGLLAAMTLGDRHGLSREMQSLFSRSGVSHVLALSGLHLGILVSLLLFLLSPLLRFGRGRWMAGGVCVVFIWMFALIAGMGVSLQRAAVMCTLFLLFFVRREQGVPLDNLARAAVILLVFRPVSLLEIGFQLSFLSVFFILFLRPVYLEALSYMGIRRKTVVGDFLYVSLAAQFATAPLVAYVFHVFSLTFLLGNMVVIPATYLLLGATLVFFPCSVIPGVAVFVGDCMTVVMRTVREFLEGLASLPCSSLEVFPSIMTVLLCYILIFLLVRLWSKRTSRVFVQVLAVVFLLVLSVWGGRVCHKISPQVVFYNVYSCPAVHFISSASHSALWSPDSQMVKERTAGIARTFWKSRRMAAPVYFEGNFRSPYLSCNKGVALFGGKRIALVSEDRWEGAAVRRAVAVDVLYLCRDCHTPLEELCRVFRPRLLVLDASLFEERCGEYVRAADSLGIRHHNIKEQGALVLPCEG